LISVAGKKKRIQALLVLDVKTEIRHWPKRAHFTIKKKGKERMTAEPMTEETSG